MKWQIKTLPKPEAFLFVYLSVAGATGTLDSNGI